MGVGRDSGRRLQRRATDVRPRQCENLAHSGVKEATGGVRVPFPITEEVLSPRSCASAT